MDQEIKSVDVYLDSGVCVMLPRGTDIESNDGLDLVKRLAAELFASLLQSGDFEVMTDEHTT